MQNGKSYFQKPVSWGSRVLEKIEKWRVRNFFTGTTLLKKSFLSYEILPILTEKETSSCTFLLSNELYHWFLLSIELTTNAGCPFILKIV